MNFFTRVWIYVIRLRLYLLVKVSRRAKCPACGHIRKHVIAWSVNHQAVLHRCSVCSAIWGEHPLVNLDKWQVTNVTEFPETSADVRPPQSTVSREPHVQNIRYNQR